MAPGRLTLAIPVFFTLIVTSSACGSDADSRSEVPPVAPLAVAGGVCDLDWRRTAQDTLILVEGDRPHCELTFDTLLVLRGDPEGVAPRLPIAPLPDGGFLTGTYQPGIVARWTAEGDLRDTFGKGDGEGPGEFRFARGFALDPQDGSVFITSLHRVHHYRLNGRFIGTRTIDGAGGADDIARSSEGLLVTSVRNGTGNLVVIDRDSITHVGSRPAATAYTTLISADDTGVWVARTPAYRIRRWDPVQRQGEVEVARVPLWDQVPGSALDFQMYDLEAMDAGVLWVAYSRPDPSAPQGTHPGFRTHEEGVRILSAYRDNVIEGVGVDGSLIASRVFDDVSESPYPIGDDRWVLDRAEEALELVILRGRLPER